MIFIALALAWAVYLIPKALQQHDELARSRSVERFSARMRVFGGTSEPEAVAEPAAPAEPVAHPALAPVAAAGVAPVRRTSRAAARRAAARRRKVLAVLVFLLAATGLVAYLGHLPMWSPAVPAVLIVAFLVVARLTVRREQGIGRRVAVPAEAVASPIDEPVDTEDTIGVSRADLAAAADQPLADDGSLWDPLPVTLPTYVSKPRARRTVRTIELTQAQVTSSGHDPVDSKLVREAEAAKAVAKDKDESAVQTVEQRRVAGA